MSKLLAVAGVLLCSAPSAHAALNISAGTTENMSCTAEKCSSTAKDAVLNVDQLAAMLAHSNVAVKTGGGAPTIEVTAPLSWASRHVLTLKAKLDVDLQAVVTVEGTGGVVVTANSGGSGGGDLKFSSGGKIDFWDTDARFVLNGKRHVLVNDIASIAAAYATSGEAVLALAKDYDAGADGVYNNAAISAAMYGTFEGLGHTISNFSANGLSAKIGFFSQSAGGVIRDITLSNANLTGQAKYGVVGALVGDAPGTQILGAHSSGTVRGGVSNMVGGLVGGGFSLGRGADFTRSDSSAAVYCRHRCYGGGLEGYGGTFLLSHASGTITAGEESIAGGLAGTPTSIVQSYATGDVVTAKATTASYGGLAGVLYLGGTITDSYSLGTVRSAGPDGTFGGFLGYAQGSTVKNSYSIGAVIDTAAARGSYVSWIGGFVGRVYYLPNDFSGAYWDLDTSGMTLGCGHADPKNSCPTVTGLSDAQLKSALPAGFDNATWAQSASVNNGYPYLRANPPQ